MKKLKYLLLFVFAATILILPLGHALALEVSYPPLPGAPDINTNPTFEKFVVYIFVFLVLSAGGIGIISLVIAGLKILLSFGSPESISDAKERALNAVLGIILLMSSYILLRTINPELVGLKSGDLASLLGDGVYYISSSNDKLTALPAPQAAFNKSEIPKEYDTLLYKCTPSFETGTGKTLLVWLYDMPNLRRSSDSSGNTVPLKCDGLQSVSLKGFSSFQRYYEIPGVYYYLTKNCSGLAACDKSTPSCVQKSSGDIPVFDDQADIDHTVRSFRIVSGADVKERYGVILTKNFKLAGECSIPYVNSNPGSACYKVELNLDKKEFNPFSAHIIRQATWYPPSHTVKLSSNHFYAKLKENDIKHPVGWYTYPENFVDDKANVDDLLKSPPAGVEGGPGVGCVVCAEAQKECTEEDLDHDHSFRKVCLNKIESLSNFNVILYSRSYEIKKREGSENPPQPEPSQPGPLPSPQTVNRSCKVFTNGLDNTNLDNPNQDFINLTGYVKDHNAYRNYIYRMDIIPYPY